MPLVLSNSSKGKYYKIILSPIAIISSAYISFKYIHGCGAGIKYFENTSVILFPLISLFLLLRIKNAVFSIILSLIFIIAIYFLNQIYLEHIHSENSPHQSPRGLANKQNGIQHLTKP